MGGDGREVGARREVGVRGREAGVRDPLSFPKLKAAAN